MSLSVPVSSSVLVVEEDDDDEDDDDDDDDDEIAEEMVIVAVAAVAAGLSKEFLWLESGNISFLEFYETTFYKSNQP